MTIDLPKAQNSWEDYQSMEANEAYSQDLTGIPATQEPNT